MAVSVSAPRAALAFDWPQGTDMTTKLQVMQQEISNIIALITGLKSQKPISAIAYTAVDLSNGSILAQNNTAQSYPIASTAKLMNAVIVSENIDSGKEITLTDEMLAPYGSSPAIYSGLKISAGDLLAAALTQSVNDAAESLAYFTGKEKFLALMNQKAAELKMTGTYFADVHGLSPKTKSSAADMVKLLTYIYKKHPEILETTKNNDFWLPDEEGKNHKFTNLNDFYSFPQFIGGKSGYLAEAGQTFAAVFDVGKKPTAIVILRATDYRSDTFRIINLIGK